MAIVAIENLCKVYQLGSLELRVLRDLDLSIEQGEYVAIMGPSGSGKSNGRSTIRVNYYALVRC